MALETNARIPSPYVYKPVDFAGKIDTEAANKAAALKAGIVAKKDLKTKNDAALAVKPTWTTEGVLNGAIENKANYIRDTYSKLAAAGIPIWDATTPEGSAFAEEIAGLNKFSNEMKGYEQNINEIEAVKGADNDAYNFYVNKIGEAKDPAAVDAVVTSYRENKDLLAKAPDIRDAVSKVVSIKPLDTEVEEIKKAALGMKEVDMKKYLATDKIQGIIDEIKAEEESKLAEKLFDFKKENGIEDPAFSNYDTYDDFLADQVRTQVATRSNLTEGVRGSMTFVNNNYNNSGKTDKTDTGNAINYTPGNNQVQAGYLGRDQYRNEGGKHYIQIGVDPAVRANAGLSAGAITNIGGSDYINIDELYKFEDKDNPAAVQSIDWVWTAKQNEKGDNAWKPLAGNYETTRGAVSGYPIKVLWDQAGNAWAAIKESGGNITHVMIYPAETSDYGGAGGAVQNAAERNASQLLRTFADNGLVGKDEVENPFVSIYNNFDKKDGYRGKGVR
mgnify:CR=1 FL=1|tara:strand:- start:16697 stop:18202 length:1506 start_codon:yes stop_codon:yes gene_type:complete